MFDVRCWALSVGRLLQTLNFRSKISPASCGLALPFDNFMTWPLRKLREAALPALKSAAGLGLAAITSSQNFSIALVSLNCSIPFSFTITAAPLPLENISAKTSLPCLPLIFPLSIKLTSSSSASGGIGQSLIVVPAAGLLLEFFAALERFSLSLNFKRKRAPYTADRVHVLDLDFRAELRLLFRPHRNVAVAAQLSLFHIGIADSAVNQDLFERREKGECLFG